MVKITKRQLRRIIREERSRLLKEQGLQQGGIFNADYVYDLLLVEIENYSDDTGLVTEDEWLSIKEAVYQALTNLEASVIDHGGV